MRLIGAGLFVFAGMLLMVVLLGSQKAPSWLVGFGIAIVMVALMVLALWLFNPKWSDPFGRRTAEEHRRVLEELGLLESTTFHATRAFGGGLTGSEPTRACAASSCGPRPGLCWSRRRR